MSSNTQQIARAEGIYPGLIHDVRECSSLGEVIEMVPAIGHTVSTTPVYVQAEGGQAQRINRSFAVKNDATDSVYSIVSEAYGVMQHADALALCDSVAAKGASYEQAGVLSDGGTVWVSLSIPERELRQNDGSIDVLRPRVMVLSDHTTAYADKVLTHIARLACNNQLPMIAGSDGVVSIRHRAHVQQRFEACRRLFDTMGDSVTDTLAAYGRLTSLPMSTYAFSKWAEQVLTLHRGDAVYTDEEGTLRTHARRQSDIDELVEYFEGGNEGAGATAWGAFQTLTGWLEHRAERLEEAKQTRARIERTWASNTIGNGARFKELALRTLTN